MRSAILLHCLFFDLLFWLYLRQLDLLSLLSASYYFLQFLLHHFFFHSDQARLMLMVFFFYLCLNRLELLVKSVFQHH